MRRRRVTILSAVSIMLCVSVNVASGEIQEEETLGPSPLIIGIKEAPPFVFKNDDGNWHGLSIDLWRSLAADLQVPYELRELDLQELWDGVADGSLDAGVGALTITAEREAVLDFSHPFYTSGLSIAVARQEKNAWLQVIRHLFSGQFVPIAAILATGLVTVSVLTWLFERKHNPRQFGAGTVRGIGSGFWWAAVTMTTVGYGDKVPATVGGRIIALVWMCIAVITLAIFTAALTSALTVSQLETSIRRLQDLSRVRVATIVDSKAEAYLREHRVQYHTYSTLPAGLQAIAAGQTEALMYETPLLRYLVMTELSDTIEVLPSTYEHQYYGIALPPGSALREPLNRLVLDKIHGSEWQDILYRYLGKIS